MKSTSKTKKIKYTFSEVYNLGLPRQSFQSINVCQVIRKGLVYTFVVKDVGQDFDTRFYTVRRLCL